ncbi:pilus assembly protein PilM [Vibrio algarum]|uniref:Pilus assembly protein PilM n=1 Tax=Vibrio algarum TaxID=3020714 RepID=A0ABT4YLF5_9VIBR|nr:pilus assembly protein PilM [Vibrio sp. KJ40-1]MDB1122367.1 pilus assembly protein PilM [Vibrio sp. KJ40-1]
MAESLIIGIDIGTWYVKAAVLSLNNKRVILKSYQEIITKSALFSDNNQLNYQEIVKKLQILKKKLPRFCTQVAVVIPDNAVFTSEISIDSNLSATEIQYSIEQALSMQSSIPIQDLCIDFLKIDDKNTTKSSTSQYRVYATPRELIESRVSALRKAAFKPVFINSESQSLISLLCLLEKPSKYARFNCSKVNKLGHEVKIKHFLLYVAETTTIFCCQNQDSAPYVKTLSAGLSALEELGSEIFLQQLGKNLLKQLDANLIYQDGIDVCKVWLSTEDSNVDNLCISIAQQLEKLDFPVTSSPRKIEVSPLAIYDVLGFHKDETFPIGFEKAIGIAVGFDIWRKAQ